MSGAGPHLECVGGQGGGARRPLLLPPHLLGGLPLGLDGLLSVEHF